LQIEMKNHGIVALWRDMLDSADVTSTVIAGGVAVVLSYGLWKLGRGIVRLNRVVNAKVASPPKRKGAETFSTAEPQAVDTGPTLTRHWQRVESFASVNIRLAGQAYATHGRATTLVDSLDLEIANLIAELAPVSSYAAERNGRVPAAATRLSPQRTAARSPLAA
jgi:hypothetical protein